MCEIDAICSGTYLYPLLLVVGNNSGKSSFTLAIHGTDPLPRAKYRNVYASLCGPKINAANRS